MAVWVRAMYDKGLEKFEKDKQEQKQEHKYDAEVIDKNYMRTHRS